jgi:hypothetical protein
LEKPYRWFLFSVQIEKFAFVFQWPKKYKMALFFGGL